MAKIKTKTAIAEPKAVKAEIIVPRKIGRPTKYRPQFCELVIELGREGASKTQMANACDVALDNFNDWERRFPDFGRAVKRACQLALGYWEDLGKRGALMGKDFNAVTYIFIMKNRFRDHYNDGKTVELGDSFGKLWQAISDSKRDQKVIDHDTRPFRLAEKVEDIAA